MPEHFDESLRCGRRRRGVDNNAGVSKVILVIDLGSAFYLFEISRFRWVVCPFVGPNQIEFSFCILQEHSHERRILLSQIQLTMGCFLQQLHR